jgi:hypothetical protein
VEASSRFRNFGKWRCPLYLSLNMNSEGSSSTPRPLSLDEYERYGRQMILPGFGLPGQLKLKHAKVAVVGAGGLGCPVLQYLAGAGIGLSPSIKIAEFC